MNNRRRIRIWIMASALAAAAAVGAWYASGSHQRHVTGLIDRAFADIGIDPEEASYFTYFRQKRFSGCAQVVDPDERWFGSRAARINDPSVAPLEAAATLADSYQRHDWDVFRWISPGSSEARMVDAYRGEDRLLGVFDDGSVSISVDSGPCIEGIAPETEMGNFRRIDAFEPG